MARGHRSASSSLSLPITEPPGTNFRDPLASHQDIDIRIWYVLHFVSLVTDKDVIHRSK